MEGMVSMFWKGRKVFLTGHTGFKGGWLSLWLQMLGADLTGYSLQPEQYPNLFESAEIGQGIHHVIGDICDFEHLKEAVVNARPEVVFHLAAQPLVRRSYNSPLETYSVNVLGTGSLLEAVRGCDSVRSVVLITTDKVYENREWVWPYREDDPLGGLDPYSSSKTCAEVLISSWRRSFFSPANYPKHRVAIASARAGNVIGGGDWSADRLVPDMIRAFTKGQPVVIRNPHSVRPWQHVLEPLRGYLALAERLYRDGVQFGEAWNFGPDTNDSKPVQWLVEYLSRHWGPSASWEFDRNEHPHEARTLIVDWSKASQRLGWSPVLTLSHAMSLTFRWYKAWNNRLPMRKETESQIREYVALTRTGTQHGDHLDLIPETCPEPVNNQ